MNAITKAEALTTVFSTSTTPIILACVISTILFAALIVYISKHPQKKTTPLKIAFIIMFLGGIAIYCTCRYWEIVNADPEDKYLAWVKGENASWYFVPYVIMRSVIDVGMMFYGRDNSYVFYSLPISRNPIAVMLFWLIHLIAFYTAASALLIRFGNDLLRWIRIMTSKISDVDLVFGINSASIAFGRNIADIKGSMLVYVDSVIEENYEVLIRDMGGLAYSDKAAVKAEASFLRNIRVKPNKTKLRVFALSKDYDRNLEYARMMSGTLEKLGILPEQTELVLLGTREWKGMFFQSSEKQYGYGNVISFEEFEMTARLLITKYPLCEAINFDANGRAIDDMNVLIVGFGRIGHEVLRKVIANGQFEGSNFCATVYDPNFEHREGFMKSQYPNMFVNYEINFEPQGGRGNKIFHFLRDNALKLKYIVVCIDDRDIARDIAIHIVDRLQTMGYSLNVYTCDSKGVRCYSQYAKECESYWLYDSELLYSGKIDDYAMELNHRYSGGNDVLEDWKKCDYFGRMSSRASVDYLMPLVSRIRRQMNSNTLTQEQRENLARSEHLRWCAFHYTFGFDVMEKEEFIERVKARQRELREYGKSSIKVTKDAKGRKHVCLVDWDELDDISSIENSLTQGNKNYKDLDRLNIDMVIELMDD